jgi:hypothetical protein
VLWVRLLDERGLRIKSSLRRRIVATRSPPGVFDGRSWIVGSPVAKDESFLWGLPRRMRSFVEGLLWPSEEGEERAEKFALSHETMDEEQDGDKIPVHFPTLYRSRCYIEEEMRMLGPHRAYDPANPARMSRTTGLGHRNHNTDSDHGRTDYDDEDDDVSIASTTHEEIYPNHLWMSTEHAAKVYVTRIRDQWMLTGSRDKTFKIWRMPSLPLDGSLVVYGPQVVFTQEAHAGSVLCLDFEDHGDKATVVTGSSDKSVKVWEVQWGTGDDTAWSGTSVRLVTTINKHAMAVAGVGLTKKYLVTCAHDGHILGTFLVPT